MSTLHVCDLWTLLSDKRMFSSWPTFCNFWKNINIYRYLQVYKFSSEYLQQFWVTHSYEQVDVNPKLIVHSLNPRITFMEISSSSFSPNLAKLWVNRLSWTLIAQISRSEEFHFGGSYAKNSSSILRPTDDKSSMFWRCALPAMSKTQQNMPERSNLLLSPTYWLVARDNNW